MYRIMSIRIKFDERHAQCNRMTARSKNDWSTAPILSLLLPEGFLLTLINWGERSLWYASEASADDSMFPQQANLGLAPQQVGTSSS